jgi:hypothetical protein
LDTGLVHRFIGPGDELLERTSDMPAYGQMQGEFGRFVLCLVFGFHNA